MPPFWANWKFENALCFSDKHHDRIDHDRGRSAENQTQVESDAIA
jgi:hypothetical protein